MANDKHISPHRKLHDLPHGSARWTDGFWAERFELCHRAVLPNMRQALEDPDNAAQLVNFWIAANEEEGEHRGVDWGDGDVYKWIEAMAHVHAVTGDPDLDRQMDEMIDLIARSQDDDGYICTQIQLNPEKERWTKRHHHELYNMGHLMTSACAHQRATGKTTFLDVARKLADYLYGVFQPRPPELAAFGWNPSNIMGLADLYRMTGEARYLELAGIFVDMRGTRKWPSGIWGLMGGDDPNPGDQNQNRVPLREETQAAGHAVTATYLWCGAADVCAETGEEAILTALQAIWRDVVERKIYVTGAVGPYHHGISIRQDPVHEAFGRPFELPNHTGYNETCANIGNAMWNRRMLALTGDARHADIMELVLYNSGLSPMALDGTRFCYTNPLARDANAEMLSNDSPERWFVHKCYCCPPQVARTLASLHEWAYSVSDRALCVHLFGGSIIEAEIPGAGLLGATVRSDYPWDGRVRLRVEEAPRAPMTLRLRIPGWVDPTDPAVISVNGTPYQTDMAPAGYAAVDRRWRDGDEVDLILPMPVRLLGADPRVEEARNQAAVARGPLVYCLESVDLPKGVDIDEVHVPRAAHLVPRHDPVTLGGLTVIEGQALRLRSAEWRGTLYHPIADDPGEAIGVRLIPYYAWLNRGLCDMRVWLPLA